MHQKSGKITAAAILASALCGAAVGFIAGGEASAPKPVMESVSGVSAGMYQAAKPKYLLSQHQGKLAVYIIGKEEPELIFDRYLHYLPDVDRLKLEEGIEVADYSELLRLIEDYTS